MNYSLFSGQEEKNIYLVSSSLSADFAHNKCTSLQCMIPETIHTHCKGEAAKVQTKLNCNFQKDIGGV